MLHHNKETFEQVILRVANDKGIAPEIIEKDYYVCCILEELSKVQDDLQTYFKGGTAIYKILNNMHRFSEDIDLTVKGVLEEESKTNFALGKEVYVKDMEGGWNADGSLREHGSRGHRNA